MTAKTYMGAALRLLSPRVRHKLAAVSLLLAGLSVLDLIAVVIVLGLTALATQSGDEAKGIPNWALGLLRAVGATSTESVVSVLGLLVVGLFVGKSVIATLVLRRVLRFLSGQEAALTHGLMGKLMRAPLSFHLPRRYLDEMNDITVGAEAIIMKAIAPLVLIVAELVLVLMLVVGLFALAPVVAIGSLVYFSAVLLVLNRWIGARARAAGETDMEATRSGMTVIQWALGGYREVTTRGVGPFFVEEVGRVRRAGAASRAEVAYLSMLPRYFLESALILGMAVTFAIQLPFTGFAGAVSGLALFSVAGFRLLPSLQRLQSNAALITAGRPFGERMLAIRRELDEALAAHPAQPPAADGDSDEPLVLGLSIEVHALSFSYPGSDQPALRAIEARFPVNQTTALVGASGSGKSTLVDVLLGLLPPDQGDVIIGGLPLRAIRRQWLQLVGYVPQSVFLMSASVRDNVALGLHRDDIDDQAVWAALQRAALADVVRDLPGGLNYRLGDSGSGLSGGQRQRLGIARALYHNPQVLILDEATSALDVQTEAAITATLTNLAGLTKIVVAHRLSTIRDAAQVIFMDRGTVLAAGTFEQVAAFVPDFAHQVELSGLHATARVET